MYAIYTKMGACSLVDAVHPLLTVPRERRMMGAQTVYCTSWEVARRPASASTLAPSYCPSRDIRFNRDTSEQLFGQLFVARHPGRIGPVRTTAVVHCGTARKEENQSSTTWHLLVRHQTSTPPPPSPPPPPPPHSIAASVLSPHAREHARSGLRVYPRRTRCANTKQRLCRSSLRAQAPEASFERTQPHICLDVGREASHRCRLHRRHELQRNTGQRKTRSTRRYNGADQQCTQGSDAWSSQLSSVGCRVRCDAASLGVPCTNCVAFSIECKIPTPKRKKTTSGKKESDRSTTAEASEETVSTMLARGSDRADSHAETSQSPGVRSDNFAGPAPAANRDIPTDTIGMNTTRGMPETENSEAYAAIQRVTNGTYAQFMKPKFARAPIKEAGRVAYLGESSNLSLLVQDRHGTTDVVHYPLPENIRGARQRVSELDNVEIDILHQRGAFLLPPRALCDELVEAYFQWIAPVVPVINRSKFMRRYRDSKNPPSLLLLQAILLAGSRVCNNPQLMDANGSTTPAAMTFYKRAKALYDANYEDDRVTIVQALILMGWYWEGPEGKLSGIGDGVTRALSDLAADVTKNVFYWSRVAVIVAQGSQLSKADKRLWKRIWWTLFTRDRSVAVALGRPVSISIEDSDVEMCTEDDFIDDEVDRPSDYPPDPIHVQFFLNYVKLCEIMGLVLSQQYSVASKQRRNNAIDLTHSDMALADWLSHCPPSVKWDPQHHHFWSALLHANYYTTLCLLHRAHMPPSGSPHPGQFNGFPEETAYPSRTIAYQAAAMITSIIEALQSQDQLRYTPAFILFSALIMHVYQMRSTNQSVVSATHSRLTICMNALRDVSKVWLVAKMVHTLFESILGNKVLEERLQRAAGRRHARGNRQNGKASMTKDPTPIMPATVELAEAQKRKFDDMEMGYSNGPPAPQMSYERSRPQSPELPPPQQSASAMNQQQLPTMTAGSPPATRHNNDAFMGTSRTNTRPTTPFANFSYPGTPPDLFLHTRNSPKLSEDVWQNYQPDQLFPPEANSLFPMQSPNLVDPALRPPSSQPFNVPSQQGTPTQIHQQTPQSGQQMAMHQSALEGQMPSYHQDPGSWTQMQQMGGPASASARADDQWSTGSSTGPIVPTTLNVGDWFEFFGIPNGDVAALNGAGSNAATSGGGEYGLRSAVFHPTDCYGACSSDPDYAAPFHGSRTALLSCLPFSSPLVNPATGERTLRPQGAWALRTNVEHASALCTQSPMSGQFCEALTWCRNGPPPGSPRRRMIYVYRKDPAARLIHHHCCYRRKGACSSIATAHTRTRGQRRKESWPDWYHGRCEVDRACPQPSTGEGNGSGRGE
nr:cutinase transcription factor 1 alpha [Quercus suber]